MIIWIDMDEVLSKTLELVLELHKIKNNKHISVDQITDYYWWQIEDLNTEFEEAIEVLNTVLLDRHGSIEVVDWAYQTLQQLKQAWYTLVVITARPKMFYESTMLWINTHFTDIFDEVYFAAYHSDDAIPKRQICHNLWVEVMIEDNHHYALDLIEHDVPTILLNRPWNTDYQDPEWWLYRVDHRDAISQVITDL